MEGEKYPTIEEEDGYGVMTAAEPATACAVHPRATNTVYMREKDEIADRTPMGMFGFYTDAPDVLEQRIAEMEADMDEVDAGIEDPEK